jgi:large subunit ribosomal protein L25
MSNVDFNVTAEVRTDKGKGASRRLRREGKLPAIIYGADKEPMDISLNHNEMMHHLEHEAFYSHILTLDVAGKPEKAVLKDLQRHPAKAQLLHADFLRVSETEKLKMQVPLHFTATDTAPGVKAGGALTHNMTEVEISCLPKDLPEYLEVDCSALEMEGILHLSDITLPAGVELVALAQGTDHDLPVAAIHKTRASVEAESAGEEGEEGGEE